MRTTNRNRSAVQVLGSNEGKLLAIKPRLSIHNCVLSFAVLNRDARRVPYIGRDLLPRKQEDKYIERMDVREYIMPDIDKFYSNRTTEEKRV